MGSDLESIGKLEIDIDYSYDYMWRESWVKSKCETFLSGVMGSKSTIDNMEY
jgi:hypothetical protein